MDVDNRSERRPLPGLLALGVLMSVTIAVEAARAQTATPQDPASIVVFKLEGDAADEQFREALTGAMRQQVESSDRYQLVNDEPVVLSDVVVVLGCDSPSTTCLGKAADHFGADYLIFGKFEDAGGRTRVSVRLFDPGRGRYVRSFGRVMEIKTSPPYESFRDEVDGLLKTDRKRERDEVTSLKVTANVQDAKVRLNGQLVGETPMERRGVSPGEYRVEVTRSGYQTWTTVIQLDEETNVDLKASLEETPESSTSATATAPDAAAGRRDPGSTTNPGGASGSAPPPSARKAEAARWGPWVAIGMGAASFIGSGIEALRMRDLQRDLADGRRRAADGETDEFSPNTEDCPGPDSKECQIITRGENTELAHRILLGAGSAMTAGGLLWLLFRNPGGGSASAERQLDVTVTGRDIQAQWRW